jgi:hypothetical protein
MMIDPYIDGTVDAVPPDIFSFTCPNAAVFAGGECGTTESVGSVSEIRTETKNWACWPAALVRHSVIWGLAQRPVFCPVKDCSSLAEKAIPLLPPLAHSVS